MKPQPPSLSFNPNVQAFPGLIQAGMIWTGWVGGRRAGGRVGGWVRACVRGWAGGWVSGFLGLWVGGVGVRVCVRICGHVLPQRVWSVLLPRFVGLLVAYC